MPPSSISGSTRRKVYLVSALFTILSSITPPLRLLALSGERLPGEPTDDRHTPPSPDGSLPGSLRPTGRGVSMAFNDNRLIFSPEYSERTGFSLGASYAVPLTAHTALGLLGTVGADKKEFLINAGFDLTETQRLIATFGQLRQNLDFDFRSGEERAEMTMSSGALSYQFYLGKGMLNSFEVNGYLADTPSNDLADKTYAVDTATLYELWNDPRRVAGGRVTGLQGRLVFAPLPGGTFKLGLGGEELEYDYLTGKDTINRATGSAEWTQQLADGYTVQAGANSMAAMDRYAIGISRALSGGHRLGVDFANLQGRDGAPDDNQIRLSYSYGFNSDSASVQAAKKPTAKTALSHAEPAAPPKDTEKPSPAWTAGLLAQVAHRPSFLPSQVVAKVDPTATQTRLVAIDKTTLPAGAAIDAATGNITAPLGVAVLSIAGVTLNGGPFTNTGQFGLSGGNSIVIHSALITQPAVGVTDTYAVTINNAGGGTTLATIVISHGSVRIDSITITHGADIIPPVTTVAASVSSTTDTATTLAATIDENGTGYYLVQAAAAAAPDAATVIAANHSFAMTANVQATANISGLTASTAYKVYFVAKDTAGNTQAAVGSVAVTTNATADIVPPTTTVAPSVTGTTDTATTFHATINENGTGYYLVLPAAAGAPTVAAVKAGISFAMIANTPANQPIVGLTASTAYKIYFVAKDAANNDQAAVSSVDVTTNAPANTPPTANNSTYGTNIGNAAKTFDWKVLSAATDVDGDTITAVVQVQGIKGVFVIAGDNETYTPNAGQTGSDICTLRIADGQGHTIDRTITVNGIDTNLVPTITSLPNWGAGVASGSTTGKSVTFGDETAWAGASSISITANNGASINNVAPNLTSYGVKTFDVVAPVNPAGSGPKTITITFTVTDVNGIQTQTTQNFDVAEAANNLPVANDVTRNAATASSITYDLAANISDVETPTNALTIVVDTPPTLPGAGGSFVWNTNTQFTYTAGAGYAGSDSFTYHVVDGAGVSSTTKTVTINNLSN